jgi:hypothetical protein
MDELVEIGSTEFTLATKSAVADLNRDYVSHHKKLSTISKFSEVLRNIGEIPVGRSAAGFPAFSYVVDIARRFHRSSLVRALARFLR